MGIVDYIMTLFTRQRSVPHYPEDTPDKRYRNSYREAYRDEMKRHESRSLRERERQGWSDGAFAARQEIKRREADAAEKEQDD